MYERDVVGLSHLNTLRAAVCKARIDTLDHVLADDAAERAEEDELLRAEYARADAALSGYEAVVDLGIAARRDGVAAFEQAWSGYQAVVATELLPLSRADDLRGVRLARQSQRLVVPPVRDLAREAVRARAAGLPGHPAGLTARSPREAAAWPFSPGMRSRKRRT